MPTHQSPKGQLVGDSQGCDHIGLHALQLLRKQFLHDALLSDFLFFTDSCFES